MATADEHAPPTAPDPSATPIDRADLDAARRQRKLPIATDPANWTACPAATNQLVVDRSGAVRTCEHGTTTLPASKGLLKAWRGSTGEAVRAELAAARLPQPHCRGCADWFASDLLQQAPPLRDHGAEPCEPARGTPRQLVLRLPADGTWPDALQRDVLALLPKVERVVVEATAAFEHPTLTAVATALRALPDAPTLTVRTERLSDVDAALAQVAGCKVTELELTARDHAAPFAALRELALALQVCAAVRCVLTPEHWFAFEDIARAAASHALPVDLRVLDRDGVVPLAALGIDDLRFVKDVVGSTWARCGSDQRPESLGPQAFDRLLAELRALLQRRIERTLRGETAAIVPLTLPPLAHPWCTDPARAAWWREQLFGHGHLECVRNWLAKTTATPDGVQAVRELVWLRALLQRVAADHHAPPVLELLRNLYGEPKARKRLANDDDAFATTMHLQPYGGPWAERLGLREAEPRKRPFPLGKPKAPKAGATADVTVLIPSYKHEDYIEETLRSVLAQRYANFKVLVVDDCSPDATVAKASAIVDPRLVVRTNAANLGLGNSVLQALATIDTPFVALLNSDDLFHPDRLARCRDALLADPRVQLVTTGMALVDQRGGELTPQNASLVLDGKLVFDWVHWFARVTPPADLPQDQLFAALLERNFLATSSNLVCRTEWLRAQAASLQSLKYCLDWQLFLEAALAGALHHIHEPLVAYRLHATNTVWFREGRRWSYYLEVNRVAAQALRAFIAHGGDRSEAQMARVLDALALHLAGNRETDGFALFLNTVFDALQVDRVAASSPRVQELVQRLNTMAEEVRSARDQAAAHALPHDPGQADLRAQLGELAQERARIERDNRRWLQGYADSLQIRLDECWAGRGQLEQDKQALQQRLQELETTTQRLQAQQGSHERRIQDLDGELKRAHQQRAVTELGERTQQARAEAAEQRARDQLRDLDGLRADLATARGALAAIQEVRQLVQDELARLRAERDGLRTDNAALATERDGLSKANAALAAERDGLSKANAALAAERDGLGSQRDSLGAERDAARQLVEATTKERDAVHAAQLAAEKQRQQLADDLRARDAQLAAARTDASKQLGRAERTTAELADAVRDRAAARARGDQLAQQLAAEQARLATEQTRLAAEQARLAMAHAEAAAQDARLAELTSALDEQAAQLQRQLAEATARDAALARESARARDLDAQRERLERQRAELERNRDELVHRLARVRDEMAKLQTSRELRAGNFLWNKMPLGYMSRRGKKWYRRLVDAKDRALMVFKRRRKVNGTAVVAACWHWPIYSHTFVYQEMIGLTHMGLDLQMFHWDLGDTAQLHKAFSYLADHRTQLQPVWENHLRDKEHFDKTKPGKLRAFLERIAKLTGRKVEDLEKEPMVLQGCTFARMAELAGANYLHSYFFYDQSFMAMQAAWLLDLPRGVSCYADHMLDDFPFKLVPLHVELCSVIVATSARIKRELSAMTNGKFDDKIIVKPNGVDGARFPPVVRQDRKPADPFEVISISRIEPKKGLTHLVEAVAALKKKGHKVVAHIVGSKDPHSKGSLEYAAEFEQRIKDLGVEQEVILHGMKKQEELPPILQRCRAFVAPYVEMGSGDKDGIPTAMLEGLASGLPVVTTDSGSILEVVTTEVEGIVVPQRDSKAFAAALERLIKEPALERRMAKAARARFDQEFDIRVTEVRLHERVTRLVAAQQKKQR